MDEYSTLDKYPTAARVSVGRRWLLAACPLLLFSSPALLAAALDLAPGWTGLRTGFSATHFSEMFYQTEAIAGWNLPWSAINATGWHLDSHVESSAGWLTTGSQHGFVGTFGVGLTLGVRQSPVALRGGTGLTLLSRHRFHHEDFGMPVQFTSHIGLTWDLGHRAQLGYRFQHMSNAGLAFPNPGLDLHAFTFSYRL
jgi:hypothetical protein